MDKRRDGHRWRRIGDWPMAVKLIAHTAGLAAALAVGLTAMGYIQAAQGLSERAEAALSSDALVVTTAIDAWNEQRLAALQLVAHRHAVRRLLSSGPDPTLVKDTDSVLESLSAMDLAGQDVESVALVDRGGRVIMSDPTDEVGGDVHLTDDVRLAMTERRPAISGVRMASDGTHSVIYHSVPVLEENTYGQVLGVVRSRSSVAAPLRRVTLAAQGLARGDLDQQIPVRSHDELGQMASAFQAMIRHQQRMAAVATTIASGDLRSDVQPASDRDVLGHAFAGMLQNLRQLVSQVSRSEERFRSLVQNASDATAILDAEWRITYISPASQHVWGHAPEALDGRSVLELVHPDDRGAADSFLTDALACPSTNMTTELRLRHADASWRDFEVIANNLLDQPAVGGIVLTTRDVTERKRFERQLQQLAFHDALTGLPNRALLTDRLERALARADRQLGQIAVLFIDLDNFKWVNDGLGHGAGDRLLVAVADRLRGCIRLEDTAARLGGDEFVVLLEEVANGTDATGLAERIAELLRTPISVGDREVVVTASIGIALSTPHHDRSESVLRNADLALYRAKAAGKARWALFETTMEREAIERLELETDLRQAIERQELRLVYQPIVSLADGQIVEMEALVRWQHPIRGSISPAQFIPIAEETGLIEPLGLWVLEEACRQAVVWQRLALTERPLVMSVNLSSRQFQSPKLVEQIKRVLCETGLEPRALKLEITESVLMDDADGAAARMHALNELGVRFAIDDFGTGYSSLSYLRRFPVETLKIDRSFVEELGTDPQALEIVRSVAALAKALGLSVTGEGVETVAQQVQLRKLGCNRGQGYLFARPLPAADVVGLLAHMLPHTDAAAA